MTILEVEQLYKRFSQDVLNIAFYYTATKEDAEDVLMDVFAILLNTDVKNRDNMKSYLLRSAMNRAMDLKRSRKHEAFLALEEENLPAEERKDNEEFFRLVRALPKRYKTPVVLFYVSDYSIAEIADFLDISQEAVKKRLERGRREIRRNLENESR